MRDVLAEVDRWRAEGAPVALATVVATWGSAPRTVGGKMAITADRRIVGSVSGGCVEGAVVEAGSEILASGAPRLLKFGVADDTAWSVGLACGGAIEVFVEPLAEAIHLAVGDALRPRSEPVAVATVLSGVARPAGSWPCSTTARRWERSTKPALGAARAALAEGRSRRLPHGDGELFVDVLMPSPRLIVVGGVHIAISLVRLAKELGYRTVLVDPREAFASAKRFPNVDEIVSAWPDEALARLALNAGTAVAVLAHDPKLDDPALRAALASPAFYVGALGSTPHPGEASGAPPGGGRQRGRPGEAARADRPGPRGPLAGGNRPRDPGPDRRCP